MHNNKQISGKILKGVGGFYYVRDSHGIVHECRARGRFRNDGQTPLPGDNVLFVPETDSVGYIEEIEPRRNELVRPRVANVDMAAIVVSAGKPKIDYMLCDKLLISIKMAGILPLIVINKCDTKDVIQNSDIEDAYKNACDTVCVSAHSSHGLVALKERLDGRCTVFAGQSAVGKSSLLNALFDGLDLKTGGLSKKTDRGKHTTRHAELLMLGGFDGTVVDTPGFSSLGSDALLPEELSGYYGDIAPFAGHCRFTSCLHAQEPGCGVKAAVEKGLIDAGRYERYLTILKELQEKRSKRYD